MDEFWKSLQDLSVNPENGGARAVVVQRGIAVSDSFNYMHKSISEINDNAGKEIGISLNSVNSILEQIGDLNRQILAIEPNGYMPNDLYDSRENLIDELGTFFPIETSNVPSGGNALKVAEGSVTVSLKLKDGTLLKVVDGKDFAQLRVTATDKQADKVTPNSMVEGLHLVQVDDVGNETYLNNDWTTAGAAMNQNINSFSDSGKLKSLVNSFGYSSDGTAAGAEKGLFPEMIYKLNLMAKSFAKEFNALHANGSDMNGAQGTSFFINKTQTPENATNIDAGNIFISTAIIDNPNLIAASNSAPNPLNPEEGNGKQALTLANMKFKSLVALENVSVQTYFQGVIGKLGVDGQQASRLMFNTVTLQQAVSERRASVSSVSLDEEMTNMMLQQATTHLRMIT
jgi:flagellar hook-associated protein 1 FlgK